MRQRERLESIRLKHEFKDQNGAAYRTWPYCVQVMEKVNFEFIKSAYVSMRVFITYLSIRDGRAKLIFTE